MKSAKTNAASASKNQQVRIVGTKSFSQAIAFYRHVAAMQEEWKKQDRQSAPADGILQKDIDQALDHLCDLAGSLMQSNAAEK